MSHVYSMIGHCMITGILLLIGLVSRGKWFCSSHDLLNTFIDETAYCTFSGTVLLITAIHNILIIVNYSTQLIAMQELFSHTFWHKLDCGYFFTHLVYSGVWLSHFT